MVKRISVMIFSFVIFLTMVGIPVMAETADSIRLESGNTTVQNSLPRVRIYCETTESYETDQLSVDIDGYPAEVISADAFREYKEGMNYYFLVDVSTSMGKKELNGIKEAIIRFGQNQLSEDDQIFLIPFGEKVYFDASSSCYDPKSRDFEKAVRALKAEDRYTNLYDAIDRVADAIEAGMEEDLKRNAVLVFTDGIDDTAGGLKNAEEAPEALKIQGTPLYAFATSGTKKSKDALGELARELNGRLYTGSLSRNLDSLKNSIDQTLTVEAEAGNAADIGSKFDMVVNIPGVEKAVEKDAVVANKSGELKNSLKYTLTKLLQNYWWILAVIAVAVIALIVLMRIRHHKGIVRVDGETVFRDSVTQKQHITVKKKNTLMLTMDISVDGSESITRSVELAGSLIVGRSDICDIYFDDPTMARQNFCIECEKGRLFVRDLESTNGTILNGVKITSSQELQPGDVIVAGKSRIVISW